MKLLMTFYCAYIHAYPRAITARGIFHVGKGNEVRTTNFSNSRNADYKRVVAKLDKSKILIGVLACSTEQIALELEKGLIKRLRAMGVPLTNETGGGLGTLNPNAKLRAKLQPNWNAFSKQATELNRTRIWKPETREAIAIKTQDFMTGMSWITNGITERRFALSDQPPHGWEFGRLEKSLETKIKISTSLIGNTRTKGKRFITNGFETKMLDPGEFPPTGWRFGRAPRTW